MKQPTNIDYEQKAEDFCLAMKYVTGEDQFEGAEKFAYQQGFSDAVAMAYIQLTGTPKSKGLINEIVTSTYLQAVEDCEKVIEKYTCKMVNCQNGHYPLGMHEDGEMEWGGCPECTKGSGRLPQYSQAEEMLSELQSLKQTKE